MTFGIVVHGGAGGWKTSKKNLKNAVVACRQAVVEAQVILQNQGIALDAVEAAVRVLEDSPFLDAGIGSYLNSAGEIELDAMIMDGLTLDVGAVAAVKAVRNPISLARQVMSRSRHNLLVAHGAEMFADSIGFPRCDPEELISSEQRRLYQEARHSGPDEIEPISPVTMEFNEGDTVGAVALDVHGNLAAATSTGGTRLKEPGRVGDSPLVGSGAYADNLSSAVSATGDGEALMKILISKRVCDSVIGGMSAQRACTAAINELSDRIAGQGGVIAIDRQGRIGIAFNTDAMPHAYSINDQTIKSGY